MQGWNRPGFKRLPVIYLKNKKKCGGNSVPGCIAIGNQVLLG
jgi:hypothetical protein